MYSFITTKIMSAGSFSSSVLVPKGTKLCRLYVRDSEVFATYLIPAAEYFNGIPEQEKRTYTDLADQLIFMADEFEYIDTVLRQFNGVDYAAHIVESVGDNGVGFNSKAFVERFGEGDEAFLKYMTEVGQYLLVPLSQQIQEQDLPGNTPNDDELRRLFGGIK